MSDLDLSKLLNAVADHHAAITALLRDYADELARESPTDGEMPWPARNDGPLEEVIQRARQHHPDLGPRQEQVLREVAKVNPKGAAIGQIWRPIDYEPTNAYLALQALARHGLIRKDDRTRPHLYYLGPALDD